MLHQVELGTDALNYLQSCLAQGHTLARHLSRLPLEAGQIITYLPATSQRIDTRSFEVGGILSRSESEPHLVQLIADYLQGSGSRCVVFEDELAHPSDPVLVSTSARVFTHGSEVYHLLTAQDRDQQTILKVLRQATSHLLIGALTTMPEGVEIHVGTEVRSETLAELAQNAGEIVVGAYDGEGEIIWMRQPTQPHA